MAKIRPINVAAQEKQLREILLGPNDLIPLLTPAETVVQVRLPIGLYSDDPVATAYEEAVTQKDKCLVVLAHAPGVTAEEQWDAWCEGFGVETEQDEQHAVERLIWNVGKAIQENTEKVGKHRSGR